MTVQDSIMTESHVTSEGFHANRSGNAGVRTHVDLPDPCLEPIILIIGDEGEWLAMTGFDSQQQPQPRNNGRNGGDTGGNNSGTTGGTPGGTIGGSTGGM
jgi:hypothetical protein